jgi:exonuclease III
MINKNSKSIIKRPFSRPALTITSINTEGLSSDKEILPANVCKETLCDIICVQETYKGDERDRPKIRGMKLVAEILRDKHGSVIFTKPMLEIKSSNVTNFEGIEILAIELANCTITSLYKPPNVPFTFHNPDNFNNSRTKIITGDFNSHHIEWGYENTNDDVGRVE